MEGISIEARSRALREALSKTPRRIVEVVLTDCGLTPAEKISILEHNAGADLIYISDKLHVSDRTTDRLRASAMQKLITELEQ